MIVIVAQRTIRICIATVSVFVVLLALFSAGARLSFPLMANYKGVIESRLSDYLRNPVDIGELSFSLQGADPMLRARDVSVQVSNDSYVNVDELLVDLNLTTSLLRGVPIINELTMVGATLAIEADEAGQFFLNGTQLLDGVGDAASSNVKRVNQASSTHKGVDVMAWLLNARKVGLLDTQVSFLDASTGESLVINDLNIRAENIGQLHQLRIEMSLPEELGGFVEAGIDMQGDTNAWEKSDGELYVRMDQLELKRAAEILDVTSRLELGETLKADIDTDVSLELWGQWKQGKLTSLRGPINSGAVVDVATGQTLLQNASARLGFNFGEQGSRFTADEVILVSQEGKSVIDELSLSWSKPEATAGAKDADSRSSWLFSAEGSQMVLATAATLPARLLSDLYPELTDKLGQVEAGGWLRDWKLDLASAAELPDIRLQANLDAVMMAPLGPLPGFGPIDGSLKFDDRQGELSLSANSMNLLWPALTDQALQIDKVGATVTLDLRDRQRMVIGAQALLDDDGIETSTRLKVRLEPEKSPHLDVQSRYSVADVNAIKQWLPRKLMSPDLVKWLENAIQGGSGQDGTLLLFGRVADFPFYESEGVFRSSVELRDGKLGFLPDWPLTENLNGTLELNGLSLSARAKNSTLDEFTLTEAMVRIDNLLKPVLQVQGSGEGNLQSMIDFGNEGPLKSILNPVFNDVRGTGRASMDLELSAQLYNEEDSELRSVAGTGADALQGSSRSKAPSSPDTTSDPLPLSVKGSVFLDGNTVVSEVAQLTLENVKGAVGFNEKGIHINNLGARVLGHDVIANGQTTGTGEEATTKVVITGAMQGGDVLAHYGNALDQFLRGTSLWTVEISAPHSAQRMTSEGLRLRVSSDLVGTELVLPRPFQKGRARAAALELQTAFRINQPLQEWDIKYDDQLHVNASVNEATLESLMIQIGSGSLSQEPIGKRQRGIYLQGKADVVAVDGWAEALMAFLHAQPDDDAAPQPILSIVGELDIKDMQVGSQTLGPATLRINTDQTYLSAFLRNDSIRGSVRFPREYWSKVTEMQVRIDELDTSFFSASDTRKPILYHAGNSSDGLDPRLLPPLDVQIARLGYNGFTLRDLVLKTQPDANGLNITSLGFGDQNMRLVGRGYWRMQDPQNINPNVAGQQATRLNLLLQANNLGDGLISMGIDDVISDGAGIIETQLFWPGPIYSPALSKLDGSINVQMERGNIISLEPGGGKMIGLFALQALPRRLEFDFKDVTADGLAFERIDGVIDIEDGIASTPLIQITGPIGVVDISGQSNLVRREFDQRISVLPRISAALPAIGVLAGGAAAGIGTLVATGFLKAIGIDLDRLGLRDYSLTGTWDNPIFTATNSDH